MASESDRSDNREAAPLLELQRVNKRYGEARVLDEVSLRIEPGEIFALLGPNGAGKTTLIRCVTGLLLDYEGRVEVAGYDVRRDFRITRQLVGLVPQELVTDDFFSVGEVLRFQGGYFGARPSEERIDELLAGFALLDKKEAAPRFLSGGMKRRLMICKALIHDPVLLFLDEPTAGVDVELREELWAYVRALRERGTTIVLTTHYLAEAEALADRIGVLHRGRLLRVETQEALRAEYGTRRVVLELDRPPGAELVAALAREGASAFGREVVVEDRSDGEAALSRVLRAVLAAGLEVRWARAEESSLEDIFKDLIGRASLAHGEA